MAKNMKTKIVIATIKPWNIKNAQKFKEEFSDFVDLILITKKEDLNFEDLRKINPKYVFFPHWSWIIPKEVHQNFECIVFHMTDLPYGRGGSPLQNLIANRVYDTKISAIKVEDGLDTGDVYLKEPFYIGLGSAAEIFQKISDIVFFKMIPFILTNNPKPKKQVGQPVCFKRRKSEQSDILKNRFYSFNDFYDFIRMLDADSYPKAFIKIGKHKILFSDVHKKQEKLEGRFEIIEED